MPDEVMEPEEALTLALLLIHDYQEPHATSDPDREYLEANVDRAIAPLAQLRDSCRALKEVLP